jgi:hypothetical protein
VADTTSARLPTDLVLTPLAKGALGTGRPIMEWLTTFHLASVVLDPYTNESSWILRPATRILEHFRGSDARINLVVTAGADDARAFVGPLTERFLVFCDPDRRLVRALGLTQIPAFAFIRVDGMVGGLAEGWHAHDWHAVAESIAAITKWSMPTIPAPGDPGPFDGSPALG